MTTMHLGAFLSLDNGIFGFNSVVTFTELLMATALQPNLFDQAVLGLEPGSRVRHRVI